MTVPRDRHRWKEELSAMAMIALSVFIGTLGAMSIAWYVIRSWLERHL